MAISLMMINGIVDCYMDIAGSFDAFMRIIFNIKLNTDCVEKKKNNCESHAVFISKNV